MPTLNISRANSIFFQYITEAGSGAVREGEYIDGNYTYCGSNDSVSMAEFHNCECFNEITSALPKVHIGDTFYTQVEFENGTEFIVMRAFVSDGTYLGTSGFETPADLGNDTWETSNTIFPGTPAICLQLVLYSVGAVTGSNIFTNCNDGTFEGGPGTIGEVQQGGSNYIIAINVGTPHTGTYKYSKSYFLGTPVNNDKLIIENAGGDFNLTAGKTYKAVGWIRQNTGTEFVTGQSIGFNIDDGNGYGNGTSGWTDATVHDQERWVNGASPLDAWFEISATFSINTDTSGRLRIVSDKIPASGGVIWVDDITLYELSETKQAISECVKIDECTDNDCTAWIEYTNNNNGFGINYLGSNVVMTQRIPGRWNQFRIEDEAFIKQTNSVGESEIITSRNQKIYTFTSDHITPGQAEALALAVKHDVLKIDGYQVICVSEQVSIEWDFEESITGTAKVSFDFIPKIYNYQNSNC